MANLKELKVRIGSVKSTQKITKAMKLVSAAKLRRAREAAESAAPYAQSMERVLQELAGNVTASEAPKLLVGNGEEQTHLFLVVTSDRGLCGGFNVNLIKQVKRHAKELTSQGKAVKLIMIGKKGVELLLRDMQDAFVKKTEDWSKTKTLDFSVADKEARHVIELFEQGAFDVCTVFYNKFISTIEQQPTAQQLIPLQVSQENVNSTAHAIAKPVYEYEPSEEAILEDLLPKNLAIQLYHAMLENLASEHGARMAAMDNATRNASDMIKRLTLQYNRTRQAVITSELIEIISGAEAV